MPTYRLFKLCDAGKFQSAETLEATDDAAAMQWARKSRHDGECQVWLDRRLIGRVLGC